MELVPRPLYEHELTLVRFMLDNAADQTVRYNIPPMVYTMADGGMGSIRFITDEKQIYKSDMISITYIDVDKTPVFIDLTIGNKDQLFEVDFWKVDGSKLIIYPRPEDVTIDKKQL